ncbi:hypothetical protein ES707_01423 [subsurface metagenome]
MILEKWEKLAIGTAIVASFTIPVFRSGGRTHLTFWQWVWNHTIFGPPIEYVPEEDYARELEGVEIPRQLSSGSQLEGARVYYQISEPSARELLSHQRQNMSWQKLDTYAVTLSLEETPTMWTKLDTQTITLTPGEGPTPPPEGWVKLDTRMITLTPGGVAPPPEKEGVPAWAWVVFAGFGVGLIAIAAKGAR